MKGAEREGNIYWLFSVKIVLSSSFPLSLFATEESYLYSTFKFIPQASSITPI